MNLNRMGFYCSINRREVLLSCICRGQHAIFSRLSNRISKPKPLLPGNKVRIISVTTFRLVCWR